MSSSYDVIVVGGGPVGTACARELARAGRRVLVLDRGPGEGAAWSASAGMLAPQVEAQRDDPLFELGLAGRALYQELAPALREATGIEIGFWQEGVVRVAHGEADAADLRSKVAWQRQHGHLCDWLDAGEVSERWPWLRPTFGALWAAREGALDPAALVRALRADAERHGATIETDTVVALERSGDRLTGVRGKARSYSADQVVLAAGAWTGRIEALPRPVSVEPLRGQALALDWPTQVPRAIVYGKDCYVVPRGREAIVGATREFAGFRAETTPEGVASLVEGARGLSAAFPLEPRRAWAGLRPVTADGLPILGREPRLRGLWYATGHGRHGILLAAITGVIIRQLVNGEDTHEGIYPLRPERCWDC